MIDIMRLSPVQLERFIHMQALVDRQANDAARVRSLRNYYAGEHPILLTQRQQEYLGALVDETEFTFMHNIVRSVLDTLRERLDVSGFTVNGQGVEDADMQENPQPEAQIARLFWDWWSANKTDGQQITLYRRVLRDSKAYLIVDWDGQENRPKFIMHRLDAGESQPGIMLHRDPEDESIVLYATRYFYTFDPLNPGATGTQRKTVYLPGEIRKYIMGKGGQWEMYEDFGDAAWPLPWKDSTGQPLGIPVIEFENPGGSEIEQLIGLQNALNKTWLDLIAAADTSGFPLIAIEYQGDSGFGSVQDDADIVGHDELKLSPGRAIEVDNARVHRLEAANLNPMIETLWTIVQAISGVSRTPAYYLRPVGGGDVPSGEALKQLESGLVKRAQDRQLIFGQSWADVFAMAYRLAQTFGIGQWPDVEPLNIQTVWTDANVRNELAQAQTGQAYKALGVPDDTIWQYVLGFTPSEVAGWKADQRMEEATKIASVSEALRRAGLQAQRPETQPMNGNGETQ